MPHISLLLFPFSFIAFSLVSADLCMIAALSGLHWGLMEPIDMDCLHGWLLIGAEVIAA